MLKYSIKRLLESLPVLLIVVIISFTLMKVAPGGPFDSEKTAPIEVQKEIAKMYKLDQPVYIQFKDYLFNVLKGDLGVSYKYPGRTVNELIAKGLPITFELGFYALSYAILIGVLFGVIAAIRKNTMLDYIPMSTAMIGVCVPSLLMGPSLVLVFSLWMGWLPVSGWDTWQHKLLPSLTLGSAYAAYIARITRGGMLDVLVQDYIRTARAKGVAEKWIIIRHSLKGALTTVVAYLGPAVAGLLTGSFVVEKIFQIPGMGRYYIQAAFNRDYTMIMGMTIMFSFLLITFNYIADVLAIAMNPKLSFENKK